MRGTRVKLLRKAYKDSKAECTERKFRRLMRNVSNATLRTWNG